MRKPAILLAATTLVLSMALTACGNAGTNPPSTGTTPGTSTPPATSAVAELPASIKSAGKIVFYSDTTYPPMEYVDDNSKAIVGFDVDMVKAMAAKLGVTADVQTGGWDSLLPGLVSHRYDAVVSTMNVTDERLKQVDFVPYAKISQVFVVRKGDAPVKSVDDLKGKIVTVQKDSTSEDLAKKAAGVKSVTSFDSFADCFLELQNKRADVIIIDEPVGDFYQKKSPDIFQVTGSATAPDPVGIAVAKDNQQLTKALQAALDAIKKDGTFAKISQQWLGADITNR